jgi:uncharacterized protein YjbJ (UPF0337 family)
MSVPNKDEVEGKWEQAKGWVKDKAGEVTNNPNLEAEGEAQNAAGKGQETWGKFKSGVGDAVDAVGEAVRNAGNKIDKG